MHRQVIQCLENAQGDRVLKVRQNAILAKKQWQLVKFINDEIEERKKNQDLHGLNPDEIIQARTGYADVDDVRKQVLQEAEQDFQDKTTNQRRPITAELRRSRADTGGSKPPGKKFKMLKELARLNQELRVQRPLSPKD